MSKNYLTLRIDEATIPLKFNNRTIDFIGDITGGDPLAFVPASSQWHELKNYCAVIVQAASNSNLVSKKEEPNITKETVAEWMSDLAPADIYMIAEFYRVFLNPPQLVATGEVSDDTRGQATNVAGD